MKRLSDIRHELSKASEKRGPMLCRANGCPNVGTIAFNRSRQFLCSSHAFADPKHWTRITEGIYESLRERV